MTSKKRSNILGKAFKYIIPMLVSVGLCYVLFTGVDFNQMMQQITRQGSRL